MHTSYCDHNWESSTGDKIGCLLDLQRAGKDSFRRITTERFASNDWRCDFFVQEVTGA
jgi:hypothetical protein